jgi:hypothetical protein
MALVLDTEVETGLGRRLDQRELLRPADADIGLLRCELYIGAERGDLRTELLLGNL